MLLGFFSWKWEHLCPMDTFFHFFLKNFCSKQLLCVRLRDNTKFECCNFCYREFRNNMSFNVQLICAVICFAVDIPSSSPPSPLSLYMLQLYRARTLPRYWEYSVMKRWSKYYKGEPVISWLSPLTWWLYKFVL